LPGEKVRQGVLEKSIDGQPEKCDSSIVQLQTVSCWLTTIQDMELEINYCFGECKNAIAKYQPYIEATIVFSLKLCTLRLGRVEELATTLRENRSSL
jgi:hypothetical protein